MSYPLELHVTTLSALLRRQGTALAEPGPDPTAMEVLLSAAQHAPPTAPLAVRIRCDDPAANDDVRAAAVLQRFFQAEIDRLGRQLTGLLREGRRTLLLGFVVVVVLLILAETINALGFGTPLTTVSESLIIIAWVALWRPAELLLFDHWPLRRRRRLAHRLVVASVDVVHSTP